MKIEQGISNFKVYEGNNDYYGIAEATLPEVSYQGDDVTGAGLAGAITAKYSGHTEAMSMTLNFRTVQKHLISLVEQGVHHITLMGSQQLRDNQSGIMKHQPVKYVAAASPTKFNPGKLAPASSADASVEFSVTRFEGYVDGKEIFCIDPINFIHRINGTDYLAQIRKNIGMN
jgi:P2 family phage contractile tail tube protein